MSRRATVDYLVVAGGGSGSGGCSTRAGGGGGGAGGYRASGFGPSPLRGSALSLKFGTHAITVGAGGTAQATKPGTSGADSTFATITSTGGGFGGGGVTPSTAIKGGGEER